MVSSLHQQDPYVVTLGTAGGPRWRNSPGAVERAGISTAIVVGDDVYLVDCGQGAGRQLKRAGLQLNNVKGIFLTHLHSDHIADIATILLFSLFERDRSDPPRIVLLGPGARGKLPPRSVRTAESPGPVALTAPSAGTTDMIRLLIEAFASDLNDRMLDTAARSPLEHFDVHDIEIPHGVGFDPDTNYAPKMDPFEIYADRSVSVTATLVSHPPMAPAFAFRFDTPNGCVTISGDTAPCGNLVRLANGTDLLLHEAIDIDLIASQSPETPVSTASLAHHRRAHTTPTQAGEIAQRAGARRLALHHLVPATAPTEVWLAAREAFDGILHVPNDLEVISFREVPSR